MLLEVRKKTSKLLDIRIVTSLNSLEKGSNILPSQNNIKVRLFIFMLRSPSFSSAQSVTFLFPVFSQKG